MTHFPPLYSLTLALLEFVGLDALVNARYLNAFLFGVSIFLFGYLIQRTTRSIFFILFGSFIFTISAIFVELYSLAMSEALFLSLTLLSFILLNECIHRKSLLFLVITGVVVGLVAITRYVGIVNIFTGIVVLLVLDRESKISRRIISAIIYVVISITPIFLWTLRSYILTTTINNRGLDFHPLVIKNYLNAFYTFSMWYLPERAVLGYEKEIVLLTFGFVAAVIIVGISVYRTRLKQALVEPGSVFQLVQPLNLIYITYVILYIVAIFISKTFLDPGTGMTNRIFSPVLLVSLLLIINLLNNFWRSKNRLLRAVTIFISLYLFVFSINNSLNAIPEIHENGMGLGRKALHNSQSIRLLSELSTKMPIYNNNPYAVYFYTGGVGFTLSAFSPEEIQHREVAIAIFGSPDEYLLQDKYKEKIELLQTDNIASIYLFKPEE